MEKKKVFIKKKENVFICDSFPGNLIDIIIQDRFGGTAEIFHDSINNSTTKIDLFFLSAKLILQGRVNPMELKRKYGKPNSKIVAMSTIEGYLDSIKNGDYGVDYFLDKNKLLLRGVSFGRLIDMCLSNKKSCSNLIA